MRFGGLPPGADSIQSKAAFHHQRCRPLDHTFEVFRKVLPVDVYLTGPSNGWMLEEHLAKAKAGDKLAFVDRSTLPAFAAALEIEFEEKFANSNRFKQ